MNFSTKFLAPSMLVVAALSASPVWATTVSTLPQENSTIYSWGLPDTAAYGQTFTVGASENLNAFSFRINDGGTAIGYVAYLFKWSGVGTVGGALLNIAGATVGVASMQTETVAAGSVALSAGQYVFFLQATSAGSANWGSVTGGSVYSGGAFVFQNNTGDINGFGNGWNTDWQGPGSDLAFSYTTSVSAVPLPAALPLLGFALGGLGFARRRKAVALSA
jgi:hypothetical protein